ncbi:hypothetical protein FK498_09075 [Elioraea sp. Yellowstone]|jgi:hypothetical protein|uniref:hypothetical protein n=1 Tax=Elioraea sp. Yellowstone TaxID=2592070 RepID=UPI0011510665|nr:hypothetical protein [Elioraea sp. Yellowstone]TQF78425.1 hypothetical protein FK498_09075 [Elioraea sp. Yellowstone]
MTLTYAPPIVLALTLALGAAAQAPTTQDPPPVPSVQVVPPSAAVSAIAVFTTAEAHAIRDYYAEHPDRVGDPPPIGVAESLTRGARVSERLNARPVPAELAEKLADRPGHEVLVAGSVVLLVEKESREIRDLLRDALPPAR